LNTQTREEDLVLRRAIVFVLGAGLTLLAACSPKESIRSEPTYHAFKAIAGATAMGVTRVRYSELLQNASTELLILSDFAKGTPDTLTATKYAAALTKYKAAQTLWDSQIENAKYDWIPRGQIFLEGEGPEIAAQYSLTTTERKMPYTGSVYQTVPSTSIQQLWELATADTEHADSLVVARVKSQ
jgi:hypothetical protein